MLPLHHDHHVSGDDRTRTGACSPDKRVLLPLSYVPLHSAGGIRTHDLELMRLAGTATPLRRKQVGRAGKAGPAFGRRRKRAPRSAAPAKPARPLVGVASERLICPAGVEPAISGAQSRRGGHAPLQAAVRR